LLSAARRQRAFGHSRKSLTLDIYSHVLLAEHTAGTEFHRASKDLKRTQMFIRHKSITTTADTYMHLDRTDLEEAMKLAYIRWQQLSEEEAE
jgi:site-specific recombinase XerC